MSAQATPIIVQPESSLPLPLHEWKRGQTIGDFLRELIGRGYTVKRIGREYRLIRRH